MIFLRRLLNNDGPMPLSVGFEVFEALRKGPVKHIFTEIGKDIPAPSKWQHWSDLHFVLA